MLLPVCHKFRKVFLRVWACVTSDEAEFPYTGPKGTSPEGRGRARNRRPERESESSTPIKALCSALGKSMSPKKWVFGCQGKTTLHRFPKNPALRDQWMEFVFPEHQRSCASVFVCSLHFDDDRFINKAQFDAGFADRLMFKDGAVPTIKVHGHALEPQAVSKTASNVCVLLARRVSTALASPTRPASSRSCFSGNFRNCLSFFYKYNKTKYFLEI